MSRRFLFQTGNKVDFIQPEFQQHVEKFEIVFPMQIKSRMKMPNQKSQEERKNTQQPECLMYKVQNLALWVILDFHIACQKLK